MVFDSYIFVLFFAAVYGAYRLLAHRGQNLMLLAASYIFYGWWDARFLTLIALSTVIDYFAGLTIDSTPHPRKAKQALWISVVFNLGMLGAFKYFNFFVENANALLESMGVESSPWRLDIILPVGISFYTFQTMSYTIDVYRKRLKPTRNFFDFALFVAFFPQLVAGPIERATHLLPQIQKPRRIESSQVRTGLSLILWGFFKKLFVANNLAILVNQTAAMNANELNIWYLLIIAVGFSFQIYADFSGYSDIARGICKLMGFDIMVNFRSPYCVAAPAEFWRHWHISLSTWLRDYLYIPLGGNRCGKIRSRFNLLLTMILGGVWHGANWNFLLWGFYQGMLLVVFRRKRKEDAETRRGFRHRLTWLGCFLLMTLATWVGWLIFRATNYPTQVFSFFAAMGRFEMPTGLIGMQLLGILFFSGLVFLEQVNKCFHENELPFHRWPTYIRVAIGFYMIWAILFMTPPVSQEFIYFQF